MVTNYDKISMLKSAILQISYKKVKLLLKNDFNLSNFVSKISQAFSAAPLIIPIMIYKK